MNALTVLDAESRRRKKMQSREISDGAFKDGSRQFQRRIELESAREAVAGLAEAAEAVIRYLQGDGEFDFSAFNGQARDSAAMDAWAQVEEKLRAALARVQGQ